MKRINCKLITLLTSLTILAGCSIKYDETPIVDNIIPEFTFSDTKMVRYENSKPQIEFSAEEIEKYAKSSESYAKTVSFKTYKDGVIDTEGSCGYLTIDTDKEIYQLFDAIELFSQSQHTKFYADVLRWDAKVEQLTGSRSDTVKIQKDNMVLFGSGFSGSGLSNTFTFGGTVSGEITTNDEK